MKKENAKTHHEVMKGFLKDKEFRKGYNEELEKLRIVQSLIELRERKGLTQSELARQIGVTQPFVAKIEAGESYNFTIATLVKFAGALESAVEVRFRPKFLKV